MTITNRMTKETCTQCSTLDSFVKSCRHSSLFGSLTFPRRTDCALSLRPPSSSGRGPGQMIVSSGNVRIFSRLFRTRPVGNISAAHRSGKKRIAHNRDRAREAGHHISHSAAANDPRSVAFQCRDFRAENVFLRRSVSAPGTGSRAGMKIVRAGFLAQTRQVRDMIRMRVGKQESVARSILAVGKIAPFRCNRRRYRRLPHAFCRIPDQIGVHGHTVIIAC